MRGGNLEEALARGSLEPEHAIRVVDQLAAALSSAHRAHTVHRDVNPPTCCSTTTATPTSPTSASPRI
jgi:serine/threonine protein kinase